MNIDVDCALCDSPLEAVVSDDKIIVRPCPCVARSAKKRVVKVARVPGFVNLDVVERYRIKTTPVRGTYLGRAKDGNLVRFGTVKKMAERIAWLERDVGNMRDAPCALFIRCPQCQVLTAEGWVCTNCGYNEGVDDG
jgi:hypothetical protein